MYHVLWLHIVRNDQKVKTESEEIPPAARHRKLEENLPKHFCFLPEAEELMFQK